MKNYWTDKKSNLSLGTLKSFLIVKHNFTSMDCMEFHGFIANKPAYLKKVNFQTTLNITFISITIEFYYHILMHFDIFSLQIQIPAGEKYGIAQSSHAKNK